MAPARGDSTTSRRGEADGGWRDAARVARSGGSGEGQRRSEGSIAEIQRSRLIAGAVSAIDENGYAATTVAHITEHSSVSRRTFYELFPNREACLVAVLEGIIATIGRELATVELEGLPWRDRIREGLWAILSFFDREPVLARVCVVQALSGGPRVLERREKILAALVGAVDQGRMQEGRRTGDCTALTAEGLVGAAFTIVHARLLRRDQDPLTGLLGALTAMIVLPYLGPAAARREQARPAPMRAAADAERAHRIRIQGASDPLRDVPVRLTYRTARALQGVAELGELGSSPSNRMVGEYAGVTDPGQISKLLARLERAGLLANAGPGHAKGEPNAWTLTPKGEQLALSLGVLTPHEREAA